MQLACTAADLKLSRRAERVPNGGPRRGICSVYWFYIGVVVSEMATFTRKNTFAKLLRNHRACSWLQAYFARENEKERERER